MTGSASPLRPMLALFPFLGWLGGLRREDLRPDLEAGLISAILILPQSIALAVLAGMPPEYGIYTSIVPVVVASLWGSSVHTLSGPNTAVCVLIAASVAPFASIGTADYIGLVLALTLMVGIIELLVGVLRIGNVLDFISQTVISGIVLAVGLVIIVSALPAFLGVLSNLYEPFFARVWQVPYELGRANPHALAVGVATVASGLLFKRIWRRYALVLAVLAGALFSHALNSWYGPAHTGIELLGRLSLDLLPLSAPAFSLESMQLLGGLINSALAIAFLGLMQTIVISRSLAMKSGQSIDPNQEIVGQGLSNIVATFFSSFASSGSFNRSAAHYDAGARTPMAAVYASLILALVVLVGAPLLVYLPMPAVAGALILVGLGLIDLKEVRRLLKARQETAIFLVTFVSALGLGLNSGVFAGVLMSLFVYLWFASKPKLHASRHFAQDGRVAHVVTIDGNLFFGSVNYVERRLDELVDQNEKNTLLLLRTDHLTYIDMPGVAMLSALARRCRERGSELYLYLTRDGVAELIEESGLMEAMGRDRLIHRDLDHPMKQVFMPYSAVVKPDKAPTGAAGGMRKVPGCILQQPGDALLDEQAPLLHAASDWLRAGPLFPGVPGEQMFALLRGQRLRVTPAGSTLVRQGEKFGDYLILFSGELEILRGKAGSETVNRQLLTPEQGAGILMPVSGNREWIAVQALSEARYLVLDGDAVEQAVGHIDRIWEQPDSHAERRGDAFQHLPADARKAAFARMQRRQAVAGETIMRQGDPGDAFYLIETGEAEVMRTDPFTQQTHLLAQIGPGQSFGEDALLQDVNRNATVRMVSEGVLQVLTRPDFKQWVVPILVNEIGADEARERVARGHAVWLDCRFEMEYLHGHLPGALHLPLDLMRKRLDQLDADVCHIVYCRSGQRSAAATYMLRSTGFEAFSLRGGISDWTDALETSAR